MTRRFWLANLTLTAATCSALFACSQSASATKHHGDDNVGDDFGATDDPTLPQPRTPDHTNDDSGAFAPGGRPSGGGTPDAGRAIDNPPPADSGPVGFPACVGVQPGDVKVVEIMISSAAGSGDKGEWVELQSTRTDCVLDLSGLVISSPRGTSGGVDAVTINDGLTLQPNATFLVADSADVVTNHGLVMPLYSWSNSDVLKNDGDEIDVKLGTIVVDTLVYPNFSNLEIGASVSFPSDCAWSDRPDWARWSYSFDTYSSTLAGTPNLSNDDVSCF